LNGEKWATYKICSLFLVMELLRLNGPQSLCQMLDLLPQCMNWQTAFLRAYQPGFQQMIDVEKWWALIISEASSYELMANWSMERTLNTLRDILPVPVEVRQAPDLPPAFTQVPLQTFVLQWPYPAQKAVLINKINQLYAFKNAAASPMNELAADYVSCLQTYLSERENGALTTPGSEKQSGETSTFYAAKKAARNLDDLDKTLARWRVSPPTQPPLPVADAKKTKTSTADQKSSNTPSTQKKSTPLPVKK
jgi:hypothetical protein